MSLVEVKGNVYHCRHDLGPMSGIFAPEVCCPDRLITHGDPQVVDCNETCTHHKNHKPKEDKCQKN